MSEMRIRDEVPVAPLREAFLRSDMTAGDLARALGWMKADHQRVARQLGLQHDTNGHGSPTRSRGTMSYNRAVQIAEALGIDPTEVGL